MKIITTIVAASLAFVVPQSAKPAKIDSKTFIDANLSTRHLETQATEIGIVLAEAQALRDLESDIINMPQTSTITPASVLALMESKRNSNRDYYKKNSAPIIAQLKDRQQVLLDANKAIKKAEYLEDEVERLRKKLTEKNGSRR